MKYLFILLFAVSVIACSSDREDKTTTDSVPVTKAENIPTTEGRKVSLGDPNQGTKVPGQVSIPAGEDGILHHYLCEAGCADGFNETGGPCPSCGKALSHNRAFHAQANPAAGVPGDQGAGQINVTNPDGSPFGGIGNTGQVPQDPPQNAKGVWHYSCPSGCSGGGGAATPCSGCGTKLAHNAAYHQ